MYQETYSNEIYTKNDIRKFLGYSDDYPKELIVDDIIAYLRKSRKDEEHYSNESIEETLSRHLKTLQDWSINTFGVPIPKQNIYKEIVSGETIENRPEMKRLLKDIESSRIKAVVCIDVQRLGRGDLSDQGLLMNSLIYSNTKVLTPNYYYDLNNKYEKKFFENKMRESAEYLEYTKSIMENGRRRSVLDGTWPHSTAPYGYIRTKLKNRKGYTLEFNQDEYKLSKLAVSLLEFGLNIEYRIAEDDTWLSIAKTFGIKKKKIIDDNKDVEFKIGNVIQIKGDAGTSVIANYFNFLQIKPRKVDSWKPYMVKGILTSPASHGFSSWNNRKTVRKMINGKIIKSRPKNNDAIFVRGIWKPIFNEHEIEVINNYINEKKTPVTSNNEIKNPLSGLLKCELCGSLMQRRPYTNVKRNVRVYPINKEKLRLFLREQKGSLSINDIAHATHISRDIISHIFSANLEKFTIPRPEYWNSLKNVLGLGKTEFDEAITTFEEKEVSHCDMLLCRTHNCKNVASDLELVEDKVIKTLEIILDDYTEYFDNYCEKIKNDIRTSTQSIELIDNKILSIRQRVEKICDLLEDGTYTQEMFNERKLKAEKELLELKNKREQLSSNTVIKSFINKEKMVPQIQQVLKSYNSSLNAEKKNKLLSSIIKEITYKKEKGGRHFESNFTLKIYLKI